ncbi:MAG: hypothetical protein QNJ51_11335 [Calothrix sp. MO_167.B12]|nr:hypothetical protein [Calothrix sp. MO_167.B12]
MAIDFDFSDSTAVGGSDFEIDFAASENIVSVDFLPDGSGGTVNLAGGVTTATVVAVPLIDDDGDAEILSVQLINGEGFELDPDTISGGNGGDTFVLAEGEGTDMITDFGNGPDVIGLADGLTFANLSFSGSDIIVTATSETLATLTGINTTTLTADDFTIV